MGAYAAIHKNAKIREHSRSGGAFTGMAEEFLKQEDTVIYGAILDSQYQVRHARATSLTELKKMAGVKYVQSDMTGILPNLQQDIQSGKKVLFSGMPCQVASVSELIPEQFRSNILLVDLICHSVPSPKIYRDFIALCGDLSGFEFRDKRNFGWRESISTISYESHKKHTLAYNNIFYNTSNMRPSCYQCPWKKDRPGDITIGDFWGIEKLYPDMDDNKGISLVLTNTELGEDYWNRVSRDFTVKTVTTENFSQPALEKPFERPDNRDEFWDDYENLSFQTFVKKYGKMSVKKQVRILVAKIKNRNTKNKEHN